MDFNKFEKIILTIDGGVGRCLCSIPGLMRLQNITNSNVYIISPWTDIFKLYNFKVYNYNEISYQKGYLLLYPEPYHDYKFIYEKEHLIKTFYRLITYEELDNVILHKPNINEEPKMEIKKFKEEGYKICAFQPFGAGSVLNNNLEHEDNSGRSLPLSLIVEILKNFPKVKFINMSHIPFELSGLKKKYKLDNIVDLHDNNNTYKIETYLNIVSNSDFIFGIDSFLQHASAIYGKKGVVVFGSTRPENFGYINLHDIIYNESLERHYCPIRFPLKNNVDKYMMDIYIKDIDKICEKIKKHIDNE